MFNCGSSTFKFSSLFLPQAYGPVCAGSVRLPQGSAEQCAHLNRGHQVRGSGRTGVSRKILSCRAAVHVKL